MISTAIYVPRADAMIPSPGAKSRALVEESERIGLEPFHAPEPLPPIAPDEVRLVCWMGVEKE